MPVPRLRRELREQSLGVRDLRLLREAASNALVTPRNRVVPGRSV